ncbi:MAG: hypothetical protein DMG54_03645 [Acidobacteria bacterium]|nr:MAG: hypothetical protein DMG53_17170 [Acidobacteriota bacterium]PYU46329.1 MAG: hypothetical protein DMG54_03645 [Acidobacteriota bacterium]PYU77244.1 MAG: hypothetical protein DMG52_01350 [Acidobacteriota bacterium]
MGGNARIGNEGGKHQGLNPSDVFYIVGYTTQTIAGGSLIQLMGLSKLVLQSNEALNTHVLLHVGGMV